jgi:hypothetical protein
VRNLVGGSEMMLWRRIRCYKIDAVQSYPSLRDEEEDQDKGQHIEPGVEQERSGRSDGSQKGRECEAECTPDGVVDADSECSSDFAMGQWESFGEVNGRDRSDSWSV